MRLGSDQPRRKQEREDQEECDESGSPLRHIGVTPKVDSELDPVTHLLRNSVPARHTGEEIPRRPSLEASVVCLPSLHTSYYSF